MINNRYLSRFFKMTSASLMMSEKVFPNIKEITESMGAFIAIQDHLIGKYVDRTEDLDVFVVGDGHTPRTGSLIACLTKWNVKSIDPQMRNRKWNIKRLDTFKNKASELKFNGNNKKSIIVCVHSHASLKDCLNMLENYSKIHIINIPCCVKPDLDKNPDIHYTDSGIHSEKNNVEIYLNCHEL